MLGPLLFLIFINDIHRASELGTWLFADDTSLEASASSLPLLESKMNTEVEKVQNWLLANKLSVHYVKKSQYMLVDPSLNKRIGEGGFELKMGNHIISRTKSYRYLGLVLDDKLSWNEHIDEVCSKLSKVAGIIFKTRNLLSKQAMMLLYHGLAGSKLRYGLICWATAKQSLLDKVNASHDKIITYMSFSKRRSNMWPLYCQLKVLPLKILIDIEYGKIMYKFRNKMLPEAFNNYFHKPTHHFKTRFATSRKNYETLLTTTVKEESQLKYKGPNKWNGIPLLIKDSASIKVFIKSYRIHLIGNFTDS